MVVGWQGSSSGSTSSISAITARAPSLTDMSEAEVFDTGNAFIHFDILFRGAESDESTDCLQHAAREGRQSEQAGRAAAT